VVSPQYVLSELIGVFSVVNSILEAAAKGIKTNSTEDNIDDQDTFRELVGLIFAALCPMGSDTQGDRQQRKSKLSLLSRFSEIRPRKR
jgi:hypothetical protein